MSSNAIVSYTTTSGVEIALSHQTVRDYLVRGDGRVTDQEIVMFVELCRAQRLNPFLREAYLIKFGSKPASIVTGKETFLKRAEAHEDFDGFEAGVVIASGDDIGRRGGSLVMHGEDLIGGWARVYRKDRSVPVYAEVALDEYIGTKADGTPNRQWARMPATMIRKVALVQALREAFAETFGGMYSPEEISDVDGDKLPSAPVEHPDLSGLVEMASPGTLERLHGLAVTLDVSPDLYAEQLAYFGVAAEEDLTEEQAKRLLARYEEVARENGSQETLMADEDIEF